MQTISLEEAQSHLAEIIEELGFGEEIVLMRGDTPVATRRATSSPGRKAPRLGTLKGTILSIAPDFDTMPEGFQDYLP